MPKIKKNSQMNFFQWSTNDPLAINKFGIPEPISKKVKHPDVLLVPCMRLTKISTGLVMVEDFMIGILIRLENEKRY